MKKIVILLLALFTIFIVSQKEAHANLEFDDFTIVETYLIGNDLVFGPNELSIKGYVLSLQGVSDYGYIYISYMPNEQNASLYFSQYYLDVKYVVWYYTEFYAVMSMYSGVETFLGEVYLYLPTLQETSFFIVPGASDYDVGYQVGYKEGQEGGFQNAYDVGYMNGYDVGNQLGYENARDIFGIYINDVWYTASLWGDMRYNEATGINWLGFITEAIAITLSVAAIEVLPGIQIGYFALFSLLFGMLSWFFFIVGKGRK